MECFHSVEPLHFLRLLRIRHCRRGNLPSSCTRRIVPFPNPANPRKPSTSSRVAQRLRRSPTVAQAGAGR
jgi:hypothetical protein